MPWTEPEANAPPISVKPTDVLRPSEQGTLTTYPHLSGPAVMPSAPFYHTFPPLSFSFDNFIDSQTRNDMCSLHHPEVTYTSIRTLSALFRSLETDFFKPTKDGSFLFDVYTAMQMAKRETLYADALERHLWVIRRIVHTSGTFLTSVRTNATHLHSQTDIVRLCQQDLRLLILDAQASITVITEFLAQVGQDFHSDSSISGVE